MSDRDEFAAFFMGFIFGGITGAVVALLLAPQSGEETRALIKDRSIELRDRAQQSAEEALARAEAAAADARARADELARELRQRGQSYFEASEPTNPGGGRPGGGEAKAEKDEDQRTAGLSSYYG